MGHVLISPSLAHCTLRNMLRQVLQCTCVADVTIKFLSVICLSKGGGYEGRRVGCREKEIEKFVVITHSVSYSEYLACDSISPTKLIVWSVWGKAWELGGRFSSLHSLSLLEALFPDC